MSAARSPRRGSTTCRAAAPCTEPSLGCFTNGSADVAGDALGASSDQATEYLQTHGVDRTLTAIAGGQAIVPRTRQARRARLSASAANPAHAPGHTVVRDGARACATGQIPNPGKVASGYVVCICGTGGDRMTESTSLGRGTTRTVGCPAHVAPGDGEATANAGRHAAA